jgi:type I restriction enzyme S subunit
MSWPEVTLGEAAEIISGATPSSAVAELWDGGVLWATPTDLSRLESKFIEKTERTISENGLQSCSARILPPNSVLFSSRAPIGLVAINKNPMATNQGFKSFVPKPGLDSNYLYWWLKANRELLQDLGNGATFKEVSKAVVSRISLPLPPIEEQRRIAAILDKADSIRLKCVQAHDQADKMLQAAFLSMFGDPESNPKHFAIRPFGTLLDFPLRNGISPSSQGQVEAEVLTLSAITGNTFDPSKRKTGKFLVPIAERDEVNSSDFYICRGNGSPDLVGRGFFAQTSLKGVAFPDTMIAARPKRYEIWPGFLEAIWNSPYVRSQIINAARTTNGTYKINQTATENIAFPVPPPAEQERYERVVSKVRSFKVRLATASNADELFASISQRAFLGEL